MTINIKDTHPESLKKTIARFYHLHPKRGQRLMIPGKDDVIFINIEFEDEQHTSLPELFNYISRLYWKDRLEFYYKGLPQDLIADRRKALEHNPPKRRAING